MHATRRDERVSTLVALYACLALFVLAVYELVVAGGGELLGAGSGGEPDLALSVLATCVVAVALEPLRARLLPVARRLTRARPTTPYEVLSRFSAQVAEVYALGEVAPRMAHVLAEGTGARQAEVWVAVGREFQRVGVWPAGATHETSLELRPDRRLVTGRPEDLVVPVRHGSELLGALVVFKPAGDPVTPVEHRLVADLAALAGLVLRNVALTADLSARLEQISARSVELTASRARLVTAQDVERRRLERDIHDGAQQHLVALVVNLRLVGTLLGRSPDKAAALLPALQDAVAKAEATLRDLARGVYPRVLTDAGLLPALRDAAASAPVAVTVSGPTTRYADDVEAAVYFCCVEALQNAVKHADARDVSVELTESDGDLVFTVRDDGGGFDPRTQPRGSGLAGLADRLEALGGRVDVAASPGCGTTVSGRVPTAASAERVVA